MLPAHLTVHPADYLLNQVEHNAHVALGPLLKNPSLDSLLIAGVVLTTGANTVNHGLGRVPQGWRVVDTIANAVVWRSAASTNTALTLSTSATTTVTLEVF